MNARQSRKAMSPIAIAVLAALAAAPAATAQEATSAAGGLEEIIVTAQKREQNLQAVPVAVSVLSGEMIQNSTAFNIEGLNAMVPALNFRKGGTTINSTLFLRGVGTVTTVAAAEPSVSTVLDGVVLGRMGEAFGDLNDIERIEVLRGPQGTLFGKNASAGVVHIISRMPEKEFGANAQLEYYEGNEYKVRGVLNTPITENLRTRVTAFYGEYDGNLENTFTGNDVNGYERYGIRGIAQWDATENLLFTFIGDYRKADDDCCTEVIGSFPAGARQAAFLNLYREVGLKGTETREVPHNLVTTTEEEAWGLSVQADWELGEYVLTSITAYRTWDPGEIREGDWLDQTAPYVGDAFAQIHDTGPQETSTLTQEIRLASPTGRFFEYVAGLYYFDGETDRDFSRSDVVCASSTLPVDATGQQPCAPGSSTYTFPAATASFGSDSKNYSIFGEGTLNFTESFRGILGLRWTNDELSYYHDRVPSPIPGPLVRTDASGFRGDTDNDDYSGTLGLQWDVNADLMTYAKYSRGYKGPAFNVFFNMNPNQLDPIEPETSDAYELGLKATVFDGSTILNLALFQATYDNFQANSFDTLDGGGVIFRLTNAGEISTSGVELDFVSRPFDGLTLSGGLAYTDAQIEKFRVPPGSPSTADTREGERLPFAPEWKGTLNAEYQWAAFGDYDMFTSLAVSYTDEQATDLPNTPPVNPLLVIPSYTVLDGSIGIAPQSGAWRAALVGKNLTDEAYVSLLTPGGPGGSIRMIIPREADRYWGVQFRYNFGGER